MVKKFLRWGTLGALKNTKAHGLTMIEDGHQHLGNKLAQSLKMTVSSSSLSRVSSNLSLKCRLAITMKTGNLSLGRTREQTLVKMLLPMSTLTIQLTKKSSTSLSTLLRKLSQQVALKLEPTTIYTSWTVILDGKELNLIPSPVDCCLWLNIRPCWKQENTESRSSTG